jgi:excisionase family DNA binding protein
MSRGDDLFTAADVARFCGVDLKTIHHWAARGKLRHHKTSGGHVRVQRVDLVAFLRAYGVPLPEAVRRGRPAVVAIDPDEASLGAMRRTLARRFEVRAYVDAVDALVSLLAAGEHAPQAIVASAPLPGVDLAHVVVRLRASEPTGHVRVVAIADEAESARLVEAGAAAVIARDRAATRARDVLTALTGCA